MSDEGPLLEALRRREPEAFEEVFSTYADRIYRLAAGLLDDEAAAEGVVQDTFLRLFERLDQFEGRSSLGTWLYRVAYNLSMDRLRARRPTVALVDEPEDDELPTPRVLVDWHDWPEQRLTDEEVTAELDKAIAALPEIYRAVFLLREVEGLSVDEAAAVTGITPGACKVRHHRARLRLRESLSESLQAYA